MNAFQVRLGKAFAPVVGFAPVDGRAPASFEHVSGMAPMIGTRFRRAA